MEIEGVVQYRLLGSHPAASGRYHSFGFSGETVSLANLLQDIVKQHQINLTKYKLEVRRLVPLNSDRQNPQVTTGNNNNDDDNNILQLTSILHTYDRIVVNVSRRHYMDGLTDKTNDNNNKTPGDHLQQVETLIQGQEDIWSSQAPSNETKVHNSNKNQEDTQAFRRVTTLSNKAFPLIPWLTRHNNSKKIPLPIPQKGNCVLCELNSFNEKILPCCHFSVCSHCLEIAKTTLTNEKECAVCGALPKDPNTPIKNHSSTETHIKREEKSSKVLENNILGKKGIHINNTRNNRGRESTVNSQKSSSSKTAQLVATFEKDLTTNMAQILSMLDVPDPLTASVKKKRRISTTLAQYSG